jgi:hypothetical protein
MKLYLDINLIKAKAERGKEKGGSWLKRVVTGTDKDGSPQYRYLRTADEVAAYEKNHGESEKEDKADTKKTHEKQKREHKEIEEKTDSKEKKKPSLLVKDKKKVEKSLYVRR